MTETSPPGTGRAPMFSILVPTYNQADYLGEALDSLLAQTCGDWEAVVVDDGSTDRTREVMEDYARRDPRIRCFHKANGGVSSALNEGIAQARGGWICWLSSDDWFEPDKLRVHAAAIEAHPHTAFFFTSFYRVDDRTGDRQAPDYAPPPEDLRVVAFLRGNYVHGISVAVRRSVFDETGPFNAAFHNGQDYDMWLRISVRHASRYLPQRTCSTRLHERQDTQVLPDVGGYDSARAAAAFLDTHAFRDLFPALDLSRWRDARRAVGTTLRIFRSPRSHMHRCGVNPALARRLREWLAQECRAPVKYALYAVYYPVLSRQLLRRRIPDAIRRELRDLRDQWFRPCRFEPWDLMEHARERARRLALSGETRESATLGRYVAKIDAAAGRRVPADAVPGSAPGSAGVVDIGMVTFNRLEFTRQAIAAFAAHPPGSPYVLTVVDNGSTDGTREYLRELHRAGTITSLVLLGGNVGVARAANLAWSMEPDAGYYLKLDNDVVMRRPGWLADMVRVARAIPEAGAVAYNLERRSYPVRVVGDLRVRVKERGNLGGACILVPRRTRDLLGVWSEDFGLYAEEDADYGLRIRHLGLFNVYMEDEEAGFHLPAGRAAAIDRRYQSASDGIEETLHADYRRFKDALRREARAVLRRRAALIERGRLPLHAASPFVEQMAARGFDPLRCRGAVTEFADLPEVAVAGRAAPPARRGKSDPRGTVGATLES